MLLCLPVFWIIDSTFCCFMIRNSFSLQQLFPSETLFSGLLFMEYLNILKLTWQSQSLFHNQPDFASSAFLSRINQVDQTVPSKTPLLSRLWSAFWSRPIAKAVWAGLLGVCNASRISRANNNDATKSWWVRLGTWEPKEAHLVLDPVRHLTAYSH